jgi:two-component system OmpR family sensor kinase
MHSHSIRVRIVLWFSGIVGILLVTFASLVYLNFRQALLNDTDDFLELKAAGVIEYFDAYWESQKHSGLKRGESPETFIKINSGAFIEMARGWVNEIPVDPSLADMTMGIYSLDGLLLVSPEGSGLAPQIDPGSLDAVRQKGAVFTALEETRSGHLRIRSRVLTVPLLEEGHPVCILQVTKPLTAIYRLLQNLRFKMMAFLPIALAVSGLTGWLLARFILAPLDNLTTTARTISSQNLSRRVHTPDARGEMRHLVDTFNSMLDKLERSFLSQQHLLQDVSHELRTPLTVLRGEVDLALKKVRSPEEYSRVLSLTLREINRLNSLIESLLFLARLDSGQGELNMQETAFTEFIREITDDLSILAQQKDISVTFTASGPWKVSADRMHLRRAFINILENAFKYTPENGQVAVDVSGGEGSVRLTVKDTGVGIESAHLPFIFDRFYRAEAARSSKGFGLGLSIAAAIIKAHQGQISVDSLPGQGSAFVITLPASPA